MNEHQSYLLNNEGISLWKSGLPQINIYHIKDEKPGEIVLHAEWKILKSLFMQIINPFGEASLAFSLTNTIGAKIFGGSFRSYHKKTRKLVNLNSLEEYDVIFKSKFLQNTSCELSKNSQVIFTWIPSDSGNSIIYRDDIAVANIHIKTTGIIAHYKQIDLLTKVDTTLLLAFIAMVYTY